MNVGHDAVAYLEIAPGYRIPRIIRGGWQLAGDHGPVERGRAVSDMGAFLRARLNTVDGADIYTGVEDMYGDFNALQTAAGQPCMQVHTKFVPDYSDLRTVDAVQVRRIITRSLQRLRTDRLDLVQFHWWDYSVPRYVETAMALHDLQKEGLIAHVGGTNFDAVHTREIIAAGVPMISMQTQYSLLDRRPRGSLAALCARENMHLLCYGSLAGGFLSEHWLGQPEPHFPMENRSLVKYKLIIDEFGGWAAFQELLQALKAIAQRHAVSLSSVAVRWVLDQPGVAAAIVGARYADRLASTLEVFSFQMDAADRALLEPLLAAHPGPAGEPYSLERDKTGPHGRIMKYDLNKS
jgi:aryl-alcohol dehydrogenase-like predicted oxidoreductase